MPPQMDHAPAGEALAPLDGVLDSRLAHPKHVSDDRLAHYERSLENRLDPTRVPRHVAVIPDGNGRWARQRGWADRTKGHEAGVEAIRTLIEECARLGIGALSVYAFSRDNWARPRRETAMLMRFFRKFLVAERKRLMDNRVRLVHSGCREDLSAAVLAELDRTIELTARNDGMVLNLAVSYGGREEIAHAARQIARRAAAGELDPEDVTPETVAAALYHPDLPDPDLLIRTSGEQRISDFLLYEGSYAELYFTPVLWPDFRRVHLLEALVDYQERERRFGKVKDA